MTIPAAPTAVLAMSPDVAGTVVGPRGLDEIRAVCQVPDPEPLTEFSSLRAEALLAEAEVLITGWGCPVIDEAALAQAPQLKLIVHTAGSVRGHVSEACFRRGIEVTSAAAANAVPVVEYTLAMILLEGKRVLQRASDYRRHRRRSHPEVCGPIGNYGTTVGILSASLIGRGVMERLRHHDVHVLLADPYIDAATAAAYDAELVTNEELFRRSDILSIHTPLLPSTYRLVDAALLQAMKPGAVLINTARGGVVDHDALTTAAQSGRIRAVLDVTDPEVLPAEHPLWECENVFITPHLAGSEGNELRRLFITALEELTRYTQGHSLRHRIPYSALDVIA
ncbi:hydroxyacid dehydrogenase [Nesterenkonia alba]|uniref:hydroxyacid dehydrogenase n=1 Tax=Nesterenkonia alba TaxID=515814 RepID=UPI0003B46FC8|nr:hydroxyacid dehydrogenase [Nesterenkonia alba]